MDKNTEKEKTPTTPWLAIRFGCCASKADIDEDEGRRALRANGESDMRICYDQPQSVPQPRAESLYPRPSTSHSMSRHVSHWVSNSRDFASRASSRASMHTLTRPRRSQSKARPSIGRPTDFRHFDGPEGIQTMIDEAPMPVRRRRSFRPLELSIYLPDGRLSPLPDFSVIEWETSPAELEIPTLAHVRERDTRTMSISSNPSESSYLIQRKPVGTGSRRSSVQSQTSVRSSRALSETITALPYMQDKAWSRPVSVTSSTTSLQRSHTLSPNTILSRLPSPSRSRASTAPSRPGSVRRAKTDVEDAIRELNTIVEERRADAYRTSNYSPSFINRPPLSPSHHVPVIAPSMRMHVRSETLSDIGSAFSVPLTTKSLPTPPLPGSGTVSRRTTGLTLTPPERTYSGPLTSNPITPPTPTVPTPTTPIQRIGAWIKRSLPSTPSSPNFLKSSRPTTPKTPPNAAPFYKCESVPPPLPTSTSRPSSAGSKTTYHARHPSDDTATVTLISSYPSTPSLSTRSNSPSPSTDALSAPDTPAQNRVAVLRGNGKTRRIPAPLTLAKEKEMMVDAALGSARSVASSRSSRSSRRSLKPPPSPNYGILRGMEISAVAPGVRQNLAPAVAPSSAVGLAF